MALSTGPPDAGNLDSNGNEILTAALSYIKAGWRVIPLYGLQDGICTCQVGAECGPAGKHPALKAWPEKASTDPETIRRWFVKGDRNLGVATGTGSGIFVLDVDGQEGLATLRALEESHGRLPSTVTTLTGSGEGLHYWFRHPGGNVRNRGRAGEEAFLPGLHIRGDGGQVVVPPSLHLSGRRYEWETTGDPSEVAVEPAPPWLLTLMDGKPKRPLNNKPQTPEGTTAYGKAAMEREAEILARTPESNRNNQLNDSAFALGQLVAGGELDEGEARASLLAACDVNGLPRGEAEATLESGLRAGKRQPRAAPRPDTQVAAPPKTGLMRFPRTDGGNGELLAHLFGDRLRFDWAREKWFEFGEHVWQLTNDGRLALYAKKAARLRFQEATDADDADQRKWGFGSESRRKVQDALWYARAHAPIYDSGEGWDMDPMLLGTPSGIVDLRTGSLRDGEPKDRIRMQTAFAYNPHAECPRWLQFLREVFMDDDDLIHFVHRGLGYSLTGRMDEQVFISCIGKGSNGKGKLLNTARTVMGDYGADTPFTTFELGARADIPADMAALVGKRMITASETSENRRLNESRVKAWTGGDPCTCRFMRENFFTFQPTGKLWLGMNFRPVVTDDSLGFWRRVRLVPFERQFLGDDDDKELGAKLLAEGEGILAWLVMGAALWAAEGLKAPDRVMDAGRKWQQEADLLNLFVDEKCVVRDGATVKASDLFRAYEEWAEEEGIRGHERLTATMFGRRMGDRYLRKPVRGSRVYFGIGLADVRGLEGLEGC